VENVGPRPMDGNPVWVLGVGHDTDMVFSVCVSPDGKQLFSVGGVNTIDVWNVETRTWLGIMQGEHDDEVLSVCVSPDGLRLFSGSFDKTIKVWDVVTGACVQTLEGHTNKVKSLCVSGNRLFSLDGDDTIKVWDVATGECVWTLDYYDYDEYVNSMYVNSVCVSPDGSRLFSAISVRPLGCENTIEVWDVARRKRVRTLGGHTHYVRSVCTSVDGSWLFSGSDDNTIKVWDVATGKCLQTLEGHENNVLSVCVSSDGSRLFSASGDNTIKVWDIRKFKIMREFVVLERVILRFRFVTDKIDKEPKSKMSDLQNRALRVMKLHQYAEALRRIGTRAKKIGVTLDKYNELYAWCIDKLEPDPPAPAPPNAKKSKLNELWCKLRF